MEVQITTVIIIIIISFYGLHSCMMFYFLQQNKGTIVCISKECNCSTVNLDFPTLTYCTSVK